MIDAAYTAINQWLCKKESEAKILVQYLIHKVPHDDHLSGKNYFDYIKIVRGKDRKMILIESINKKSAVNLIKDEKSSHLIKRNIVRGFIFFLYDIPIIYIICYTADLS